MNPSLADRCQPSPGVRVGLLVIVILLSSNWTCSAIFVSCQGIVSTPQITALSPGSIESGAESAVLTVEGRGFSSQSQIMWNGKALPTTQMDQHHLQATITQQTFEAFGGSPGTSVQIAAHSQGMSFDTGCPISGNSNLLVLVIN